MSTHDKKDKECNLYCMFRYLHKGCNTILDAVGIGLCFCFEDTVHSTDFGTKEVLQYFVPFHGGCNESGYLG